MNALDSDRDDVVLTLLRAGDEEAFRKLVGRHQTTMLRVARLYVRDAQAAEEVVQETWMAVVRGIDRFEGRSTLATWLFRILVNRARSRGLRDSRITPFSSLVAFETSGDEAAVDADRFQTSGGRYPGHWAAPPPRWEVLPEEHLLSQETLEHLAAAIDALPPAQRAVIRLRDVEGWEAAEVCSLLGLSQANQRVLLHRARSKVRSAIEHLLSPGLVA